ncbi:hypothetical protein EHS25_003636 [Saitozyma podzolica]|uniref:FAD dependent oxidoreductase domain-containing protein n=1 Tax=Saitozyma podzolica TaxID=1890683 RepID=A0A427Y7S0_9TREE|nr:hypothetical protein EHS25_003636 [Saitozyma podzolica]
MPISTSIKPRVTVLGSGVVGLTCALDLSKDYDVTIVARNMPGDPPSLGWASPWAGAMWFGVDGSTPAQEKMQRESFQRLWQLAEEAPESSVRFRELDKSEIKHGVGSGVFYTSVVVTPDVYLPWLRAKLESAGVRFLRAEVPSLAAAAKLAPCDLVVNASGNGARFLLDVADEKCVQVRGQTMLVKCDAPEVHIRHALRWDEYTYVLPRGDGTAILGGIKEFGNIEPGINEQLKRSIHQRCHAMLPAHVPAKFEDLEIVRDLVGIRPEREGGVRVELEDMAGLKVVHAAAVKKLVDSAV